MLIHHSAVLKNMSLTALSQNIAENGELTVIEGLKEIPYNICRVFFVRGDKGAIRGMHAHRECSQFLICLSSGICEFITSKFCNIIIKQLNFQVL